MNNDIPLVNPFKIKLPANMLGKDYIIGDLHGDYDSLMKLLKFVKFSKANDRLFCVGDLIHRGPKSNECLSLLNERRHNGERWFYSTLGNHDVFFEQEAPQFKKYLVNYMPYRNDLNNLPFMYEVEHPVFGHFWVTHGELSAEILFKNNISELSVHANNKDLNSDLDIYRNMVKKEAQPLSEFDKMNVEMMNNDLTDLIKETLLNDKWLPDTTAQYNSIWGRELFSYFFYYYNQQIANGDFSFLNHFSHRANKLKIFSGHNLVPFPMVIGNQIYCDTGACFGYDESSEQILKGFSLWGSQFFGLTIIDVNMGIAHSCISSEKSLILPDNKNAKHHIQYQRGDIVTLQKPLYQNIFEYNQ